jgi:hypothetical protein
MVTSNTTGIARLAGQLKPTSNTAAITKGAKANRESNVWLMPISFIKKFLMKAQAMGSARDFTSAHEFLSS